MRLKNKVCIITGSASGIGFAAADILNTVPEHILQQIESSCWQKRIGKPEELANVYAFLASDEASYVNGATL